jgi:uncharacterized protein (TIGR02147 family)
METTSPSIFEFTDYHQFFKSFYQFNKAKKKSYSFRYLARLSDVSASMLAATINGKRKITVTTAEKIAKVLNFSVRETDYLLALVSFEKAKNHLDKNEAFSRIINLRGQSKQKFLDTDQYEYYSRWYHSAIRELVSLPFFKEDPSWIAQMLLPNISVIQAQKSLQLLLRLKLITRDEKGTLHQTNTAISSEYEIHTLSIRNFSREMIDRARESLETVPVELREISGITMGISEACIDRIKQRIRIFKEELVSMVIDDKSESSDVYQFNIQFFPIVNNSCNRQQDKSDESQIS